jgi:hypothetical protein
MPPPEAVYYCSWPRSLWILRQQPPVGCSEPPAFRDEIANIIVYAIHALDQFS